MAPDERPEELEDEVDDSFPLAVEEACMVYGMMKVSLSLASFEDRKDAFNEASILEPDHTVSQEQLENAGQVLLEDLADFISSHLSPERWLMLEVNLETKIKQLRGLL